jgi:hypothetical protein
MNATWTTLLTFLGRSPVTLRRLLNTHLPLLLFAPAFWITYFNLAGPGHALRWNWLLPVMAVFAVTTLVWRNARRTRFLPRDAFLLHRSRASMEPGVGVIPEDFDLRLGDCRREMSPRGGGLPTGWGQHTLALVMGGIVVGKGVSCGPFPKTREALALVRRSLGWRLPLALGTAAPFVAITALVAREQRGAVMLFLGAIGLAFGLFLYSLLEAPLLDLKLVVEIGDLLERGGEGDGQREASE